MTPQELIRECADAGIHLEPDADEIVYRAPKGALTPDLADTLRQCKLALLQELRHRQEREREARADQYWRRLQSAHDRAGGPSADTWLTDAVRAAERRAEKAWIAAREQGTRAAHRECLDRLLCWYLTAHSYIGKERPRV